MFQRCWKVISSEILSAFFGLRQKVFNHYQIRVWLICSKKEIYETGNNNCERCQNLVSCVQNIVLHELLKSKNLKFCVCFGNAIALRQLSSRHGLLYILICYWVNYYNNLPVTQSCFRCTTALTHLEWYRLPINNNLTRPELVYTWYDYL